MRGEIIGFGADIPIVYALGDGVEVERIDEEVEVRVIGLKQPFRTLIVRESETGAKRTGKYRPLVAGVSVGHANITAGTLGWLAKKGDKMVMVSNAHVLHPNPCSDKPPVILDVVQPGVYDGGLVIGDTVAYYHSHVPLGKESDCPVSRLVAWILNSISRGLGRKTRFAIYVDEAKDVDIALASIRDGVEVYPRVVMDDGSIVNPVEKGWRLAGFLFGGSGDRYVFAKVSNVLKHYPDLDLGVPIAEEIVAGMKVVKCGRTTGCTEGVVETASAYVRVMGYPCGEVLFGDVAVVVAKSQGGDSGSAVWVVE